MEMEKIYLPWRAGTSMMLEYIAIELFSIDNILLIKLISHSSDNCPYIAFSNNNVDIGIDAFARPYYVRYNSWREAKLTIENKLIELGWRKATDEELLLL